ncbi:MAG: tetratricopeptide repeat protein, partial [Akkermansiaceae bacterium]
MKIALLLASSLALATTLSAQGLTPNTGTCRCCNLGRIYAPYLKKLPPPQQRNDIGNSHIKITTTSKKAQQWFDQGLNLLHAFWEFEAYRCFLQAAKEDPECAMAYWGICMSLPGKLVESANERALALKTAKELSSKASDHEQLYIQMVEKLINNGSSAAATSLRTIVQKYPNDPEAKAWLALWLRAGYGTDGKPLAGTSEALKILRPALEKHPMHTGLNHYMIHVLEQGPDFEQARTAAIALPKAAPGAGHLVHMPGHIYYLAGEYEKACQAFRACHRVETNYLKSGKIPAIDNNNYLHNLHFLTYAAADQGKYQEALQTAAIFSRTQAPPSRSKSAGASQIHYLATTATALVHMRAGKFDLAAASLLPDSIPQTSSAKHYILFLRSYCRLQHTMRSATPDADLIRSEKLAATLHFNNLNAAKPLSSGALHPWTHARAACKVMLNEIRAWTDNPIGQKTFKKTWAKLAIREMSRSGYSEPPLLIVPVEESLGWLALRNDHHAQARDFFQASLKTR